MRLEGSRCACWPGAPPSLAGTALHWGEGSRFAQGGWGPGMKAPLTHVHLDRHAGDARWEGRGAQGYPEKTSFPEAFQGGEPRVRETWSGKPLGQPGREGMRN